MTEDEMVGWHHRLNGHEFEHTPGDSEGQGSLACCSSWGHKESDMTEEWTTTTKFYCLADTFGLLCACVICWSVNDFNSGGDYIMFSFLVGIPPPCNFQSLLALGFDFWYIKPMNLHLSSDCLLSCVWLGPALVWKNIKFIDCSLSSSFFHERISFFSLLFLCRASGVSFMLM